MMKPLIIVVAAGTALSFSVGSLLGVVTHPVTQTGQALQENVNVNVNTVDPIVTYKTSENAMLADSPEAKNGQVPLEAQISSSNEQDVPVPKSADDLQIVVRNGTLWDYSNQLETVIKAAAYPQQGMAWNGKYWLISRGDKLFTFDGTAVREAESSPGLSNVLGIFTLNTRWLLYGATKSGEYAIVGYGDGDIGQVYKGGDIHALASNQKQLMFSTDTALYLYDGATLQNVTGSLPSGFKSENIRAIAPRGDDWLIGQQDRSGVSLAIRSGSAWQIVSSPEEFWTDSSLPFDGITATPSAWYVFSNSGRFFIYDGHETKTVASQPTGQEDFRAAYGDSNGLVYISISNGTFGPPDNHFLSGFIYWFNEKVNKTSYITDFPSLDFEDAVVSFASNSEYVLVSTSNGRLAKLIPERY